MPTFGINTANDVNNIRGGTRFHIGEYTAAGGDATVLHYMGLAENDVVQQGPPETEDIDGGSEFLSSVGAFFVRNVAGFTFTLREVPIDILGILQGGLATFSSAAGVTRIDTVDNVSGDYQNRAAGNDREMAIGTNQECVHFYQIVAEHPNEGQTTACDGLMGWTQLWKCRVMQAGDISRPRNGLHTVPVAVMAYTDPSVVVSVDDTPLTGATALGQLGRYHVTY